MRGIAATNVLTFAAVFLASCGAGRAVSDGAGVRDGAVQVLPAQATAQTRLVLEGRDTDPVFDGIGGLVNSSALLHDYPEPQRSAILDYLFKPGVGQALQVLKLEVGGDTNSTVGSESAYRHAEHGPANVFNGYETWIAIEAKKRNPGIKLWGLQWGAPGWVGAICSPKDAQYLADWVKRMREQAGLTIDYLSAGQNENRCVPNQATGSLDDEATIQVLRRTLDANGLAAVKVIGYDGFDIPPADRLHAATLESLYAVGVHYPGGWQKPLDWTPPARIGEGYAAHGVRYWVSEDTDFQATRPPGTLTRQYNYRYLQSAGHLIVNWSPVGATYADYDFLKDADVVHFPTRVPQMTLYATEPWSGHYELVPAPFWSIAHTTRFTEPGWRYVAMASRRLPQGGSVVSYRSGRGAAQDWTTTIETTDASAPQTVRIEPGPGMARGALSIVTSSDTAKQYFRRLATVGQGPHGIVLQIAPHAIVTVSTLPAPASDGAAPQAPASAPFPTTHADTFADYPAGTSLVRYLAPQQGAYEIQACRGGRTGRCLTQVAPSLPIRWDDKEATQPFALIGDPLAVEGAVEADVLLPSGRPTQRFVGIGTRAQVHNLHYEGYRFVLDGTGRWTLQRVTPGAKATQRLRQGHVRRPAAWHRLALRIHDGTIAASIDGAVVAKLALTERDGHGQAALLSSYGDAQFAHFKVTRTR